MQNNFLKLDMGYLSTILNVLLVSMWKPILRCYGSASELNFQVFVEVYF